MFRSKQAMILSMLVMLSLVFAGSAMAMENVPYMFKVGFFPGDPIPENMTFQESPLLAERVARGELPPVEERLPLDIQVLQPLEDIGQYGGTIRLGQVPVQWTREVGAITGMGQMAISTEDGRIVADIARGWEMSDDALTYTLYLRRGLKWSDGEPFTVDAFMFWYEAEFLNSELTPSPAARWNQGGELMVLEPIDDYTLVFHFAAPHPVFHNYMKRHSNEIYLPRHYMEEFHPDYADAEELAQKVADAGFTHWRQLWTSYRQPLNWADATRAINAPTLLPYIVKERSGDITVLERNPYYFKVDPEGNQLPYIDYLRVERIHDAEVRELKAVSGELDYYSGFGPSLPLYFQSADANNYKVYVWWDSQMSSITPFLNLTHQDPVLREIFQDMRFRIALSHAINRDEMNELIYFGLAEPRQGTVIPPAELYREEFATRYTEYDVELANELLDEMGLQWSADGSVRLRPDGRPLQFILDVPSGELDWVAGSELLADYWAALGVDVRVELKQQNYIYDIITANQHDATMWGSRMVSEQMERMIHPFLPSGGAQNPRQAPLWGMWYDSQGAQGEEPPEEMKALYAAWDVAQTDPDPEAREAALFQIVEGQADHLWYIGTVGIIPMPLIVSSDLRNVPDNKIITYEREYLKQGHVDTWYFAR